MSETTYVTIDKLAEHFGLAVTTLQKWVKTGNIPRWTYVKAGQTYRFNLRAVEQALTGAEDAPKLDIRGPADNVIAVEIDPDEDM